MKRSMMVKTKVLLFFIVTTGNESNYNQIVEVTTSINNHEKPHRMYTVSFISRIIGFEK